MRCEYCGKGANSPDDIKWGGTHEKCRLEFHRRQNGGMCVVCGEILDGRDHEWGKNCHSGCEGLSNYRGY